MSTALGSLRYDDVGASLGSPLRFTERVGLVHEERARFVDSRGKPTQVVLGPRPRGRDHTRPSRHHSVDLLLVHAEEQQIQAERPVRKRANLFDRSANGVRGHRAHAQRTESARTADRGNKLCGRGAGHSAEHDRMTNAE